MTAYCTFRVDAIWFGIDVVDVQEVIRHQPTTRVPTAPSFVRGLINLRGQIVTVLDLRGRLGLALNGTCPESPMDVIVRNPGGPVGLVVDELGDVVEFDGSKLDRNPESIPESVLGLISGQYGPAGRPLLVLDIARVVE